LTDDKNRLYFKNVETKKIAGLKKTLSLPLNSNPLSFVRHLNLYRRMERPGSKKSWQPAPNGKVPIPGSGK
jgi:hypothetical protein